MFAGSGPHEAETKRLAGKLGIGGRVHFLGYVDNRSVPALLSHCDMSVLPSLRETFGVSGVEPLLLGKPVVASRVGVLPELERTGGVLCVPPGDAGAIGRAVEGVMDNYPEAARRARAGRAWVVEQCDLPRAARAYAQVYERLAAGGRP